MKRVIVWSLFAIIPTLAAAAEFPLLGSWKLESYTLEAGGKRTEPFGPNPVGAISYMPDGRMHAILAPASRPRSTGSDKDDAALLRAFVAYTGRYMLESPGKVVHHVDVSWNETLTGTDQIRYYTLEGDKLTLTGPPVRNAAGQESKFALVWRREKK